MQLHLLQARQLLLPFLEELILALSGFQQLRTFQRHAHFVAIDAALHLLDRLVLGPDLIYELLNSLPRELVG